MTKEGFFVIIPIKLTHKSEIKTKPEIHGHSIWSILIGPRFTAIFGRLPDDPRFENNRPVLKYLVPLIQFESF